MLYNYDLVKNIKVLLKKPWAPIGRHLDTAAVEIIEDGIKLILH